MVPLNSITSGSHQYLGKCFTASVLNVRVGAGTNYNVITTVKKDTVHELLEEKNGWGKIKNGWVSSQYNKKL